MFHKENRLKLDIMYKIIIKIILTFRHGFGSLCSSGLKDSVSILEEENNMRKIIYPIG